MPLLHFITLDILKHYTPITIKVNYPMLNLFPKSPLPLSWPDLEYLCLLFSFHFPFSLLLKTYHKSIKHTNAHWNKTAFPCLSQNSENDRVVLQHFLLTLMSSPWTSIPVCSNIIWHECKLLFSANIAKKESMTRGQLPYSKTFSQV